MKKILTIVILLLFVVGIVWYVRRDGNNQSLLAYQSLSNQATSSVAVDDIVASPDDSKKNDLLKETRDLGEDSIRRVRIALGYLGLALRGSEPYPFPSQDELYQMPTSFILSARFDNA